MRRRPDRRRPAAGGIAVERDAETVFRAAILAGVLSAAPEDRNRAGHHLYLFHDEEANVAPGGAAWFRQSLPPRLGGRGRPPRSGATRGPMSR